MIKKYMTIFIGLFSIAQIYSQVKEASKIDFEQLKNFMSVSPRPILINITTDWCAICKIQYKQLLKNPELIKAISQNYYFIQLNAETKETIVFNNKKYSYVPNGISNGIHELAFQLGNIKGQLSYPTWVILNQNYEIIFQHGGLIKSDILNKLH